MHYGLYIGHRIRISKHPVLLSTSGVKSGHVVSIWAYLNLIRWRASSYSFISSSIWACLLPSITFSSSTFFLPVSKSFWGYVSSNLYGAFNFSFAEKLRSKILNGRPKLDFEKKRNSNARKNGFTPVHFRYHFRSNFRQLYSTKISILVSMMSLWYKFLPIIVIFALIRITKLFWRDCAIKLRDC